jgi:hypothetical protein
MNLATLSRNHLSIDHEPHTFVQKTIPMKSVLLLLSFAIIFGGIIHAQHDNVMISSSNSPEEPAIYVNPYNTDKLIAGSNINNLFHSTDGGYTWTVTTLYSASYGVWGDPVTIVDTAGNYYFFHLSNPPAGSWIDRIVCQKSTDEGITWNDGSYMGLNGNKAQDKEWAVIDRTNNTIYVTWTEFDQYGSSNPNHFSRILFSKSTDEGESWTPALSINEVDGNCIDSDETTEGAVPAVGPNGEVFVAWAGPAGLVFDRSLDGGETWLEEDIFIDEFPGGWDYDIPGISRCNGLPIIKFRPPPEFYPITLGTRKLSASRSGALASAASRSRWARRSSARRGVCSATACAVGATPSVSILFKVLM